MSAESMEWLNTNTLIGFTDKRRQAWHYNPALQGAESNHYAGAIPVEDLDRRLFNFQALETPIYHRVPADADRFDGMDDDGSLYKYEVIPGHKSVEASDNHHVFDITGEFYQPHGYREWLYDNLTLLLDNTDLAIGSAGLLKNRAVAWVQIETPETITLPSGMDYYPFITATTSFNRSLKTKYLGGQQVAVCDNTLRLAEALALATVSIGHTRHSHLRLGKARDALQIGFKDMKDRFSAEIEALSTVKVSDMQWDNIVKMLIPVPATDASSRSKTIAENKTARIRSLYAHDPRCEPWKGTGLGVLQTWNTYYTHYKTVRNSTRDERNKLNFLDGTGREQDAEVLQALRLVTDTSPLPVQRPSTALALVTR